MKVLVGVCVGVFFAQAGLAAGGISLPAWLGLVPADFWGRGRLWQPVTYIFLHGGLLHILVNAYMLWALGDPLERRWGRGAFLRFFFLCGIGAGLVNAAIEPRSVHAVIGASGAVYGIMAAFALIYPDAIFYVFFVFPLRARHAVLLFAGLQLYTGLTVNPSGVATIAHLAGLALGFLLMKVEFWRHGPAEWGAAWRDARRRRAAARSALRFHELGAEVDRLLEKIARRGLDSLSPEERRLMDLYSRERSKK